jgi:voltage-gated potassium channel
VLVATWRLLAIFALVYVAGALAFWKFEQGPDGAQPTVGEAFYYGIVTLSTVGYGDMYPKTRGGQWVAIGLILFALTMLGYFLTKISDAVMEARRMEELGMNGTQFENHVVVLGWSKIARTILGELMAAGRRVAVLTSEVSDLPKIREFGPPEQLFVCFGNPSNPNVLPRTGTPNAATVIICSDDDTENIVLSLMVRSSNPDARIIVSVQREELRETLTANGVTYVASPFELSARLVASAAFEPEVARFVEDITTGIQGDYDLQQFTLLEGSPAAGKNVGQISEMLTGHDGPLLVGVAVREGEGWAMKPNPPRDLTLQAGDITIVLGTEQQNGLVSDLLHAQHGR